MPICEECNSACKKDRVCELYEPVIPDDYTTLEQMRIEHDVRNMVIGREETQESVLRLISEGAFPQATLIPTSIYNVLYTNMNNVFSNA